MKHLWDIKVPNEQSVQGITQALGIHPLLAQCLVNRELIDPEEVRSFLNPKLADLAAPELIPNMGSAVERLFLARAKRRRPLSFLGITMSTGLLPRRYCSIH